MSTFSSQASLPHQPVPSLDRTVSTLLETLRPLGTPSEFERCRRLADELLASGGAEERQRWLHKLSRTRDSWLNGSEGSLWLTLAYWAWTDFPLPCGSNVVGFMFLENIGAPNLDQVFSAAAATAGFMRFKSELDAGRVTVHRDRKGMPLCMDQWRAMYGTTRIPGFDVDTLDQSPSSQHIVAMRNGHMFRIDFGDMAHLCWAFGKVMAESTEKVQSVGALTGWTRKKWAEARTRLISLCPDNSNTLRTIESAAFIVVLDSEMMNEDGGSRIESSAVLESDDDQVRRFHHYSCGKWGGKEDRWFDKSFTVIVNPVGQVGLNVEHSWAEASVPLSVMSGPVASFVRQCYANDEVAGTSSVILRDGASKADFLASQRRGHGGCYALQPWNLDRLLIDNIAEAEATLAAMEADSDISLIRCHDYSARTIKAHIKVSPDSCLQMAIQLAFYRTHGRHPQGTYETAVLTQFLRGRTATCRVQSTESHLFCQAMVEYLDGIDNCSSSSSSSSSTSKNKAIVAFKAACKSHISYIQKTSRGEGVDRHLLALSAPLPPSFGAPPPATSALFRDPLYLRAQSWELSTSNNSYLDNSGGHFGTVNPKGYGIGYLAKNSYTYFAVECKRSAQLSKDPNQSAAKRMSVACVRALADIHELFSLSPEETVTAKM